MSQSYHRAGRNAKGTESAPQVVARQDRPIAEPCFRHADSILALEAHGDGTTRRVGLASEMTGSRPR